MNDFLQSLNGLVSGLPFGDTFFWPALMFIVVLSVLVYIHELGHYLAARSVGVAVETFSIGFGKEIWGRTSHSGTRWKVAAVPLGGYVRMYGDETTEGIPMSRQDEAFLNKTVWQRMWVVFAGPLANFLLAIVFLMGMMYSGEQVPASLEEQSATVGMVMEGEPAEAAGLQPGDVFVAVNGNEVNGWLDMVERLGDRPGEPTPITVKRDNTIITMTLTPEPRKLDEPDYFGRTEVGRIGIGPLRDVSVVRHGPVESFKLGFVRTWELTAATLDGIWKMIVGEISAKHIGGPILIAEVAGSAAEQGLYPLLWIMVIISINLGILNLLPIPVLDGGHLLYYAIEAIKGSPVSDRVRDVTDRVGLAAVLMLMGFALFNDLTRAAL